MALLWALGGVGDEVGSQVVATITSCTVPRVLGALRGFDGTVSSGVGERDGAVGVHLSEMPAASCAVGEVILEAAVGKPAGVIDVVLDLAVVEAARDGISTIVILERALGMEGRLR